MLAVLLCASYGAPVRSAELTVYGIVDAAIGYARNGDGKSLVEVRSGQASSSRLGLRGSEPLGANLEAIFNLEASTDIDTGAGDGPDGALAWNRQSWVGLSGRYGVVMAGRQYRPETRAVFAMDPFDGSSIASPPNTYSNLVYRTDNAIVYETPRLAGLQALVMIVPGEGPDGPSGAREDRGLALFYRSGPLRMAYGWDRRVNAEATDGRVWQSLGGSYDLGAITLYGAWRSRKEDDADLKERSYWIGMSAPLGGFTLRGVLGAVEDRSPDRRDTTGLGLGLEYRLSKRADLYGRYARLRNRNGAGFDLGGDTAGSSPQSLALGLRLHF